MFYFYKPLHILYFIFPCIFFFLGFYLWKQQQKKGQAIFGKDFFQTLSASVSWRKRKLRFYLELSGLCFLILALARPLLHKRGEEKQELEGVEMIIAVDVSRSMLVEDVRPSRLRFVKSELHRLLEKLTGNKIGLIAFAGNASVLSPLTVDLSAVEMFVDSLSSRSVYRQGTLFRPVLDLSADLFKKGGSVDKEGKIPSRLVLLISDGEDHDRELMEKSKELAQKGIRLFTMVVGTEQGAPIPMKNEEGQILAYKRDSGGKLVLSKRKDTSLKKLAQWGKGSFYAMSLQSNYLQSFLKDLQSLEKSRFTDLKTVGSGKELYGYFLSLAFAFFFLFFVITERRHPKKAVLIFLGFFSITLLFPFSKAFALFPSQTMTEQSQSFWHNRKALKALKEKDLHRAQMDLNKALSKSPFDPALHLNMGLVFLLQGAKDKAWNAFLYSAQIAKKAFLKNPKKQQHLKPILFSALFNLALLETEKQKWDKALHFYQQALSMNPESLKVRTNIELLRQQKQQQGKGQQQRQNQQQQNQRPSQSQNQEPQKQPQESQQPQEPQEQRQERERPFKSKEISKEEVQRILEELTRQEQEVRKKVNQQKKKRDFPPSKDW